jgi:hypothetical protein
MYYMVSLALMNMTEHENQGVFVRKNSLERKYESDKTERALRLCPARKNASKDAVFFFACEESSIRKGWDTSKT